MNRVLKTNKEIIYDAASQSEGIVYMRIASKIFNDLQQKIEVSSQYYRIDQEGKFHLILAQENVFTWEQLDQLIAQVLQQEINTINPTNVELAFYMGAIGIIHQKNMFGTTAVDWDIYVLSQEESEIHNRSWI